MNPLPATGYLPLRYVLTDTLAVRTSLDPLRIDSEHSIGGRAQRGMLAAALRRAGRERELSDWVARGDRIRFAPAYPRLEPGADPDLPADSAPARALVAYPAPAHLYTPGKDGDTTVDVFAGTDPATPYRAVRGHVTLDRSLRAAVRTTAEQYLGRSRTGDRSQGVPFFAVTVDPGQVFEARWQLLAADGGSLRDLAERVAEVLDEADGTLTLGSGGTRAHGGVSVTPADPDRLLSPDRVAHPHTRHWPPGAPLDLLLLSPALLVGEEGQSSPRALVPAVLDLLARRLPGSGARVLAHHVEAGLLGAYHRGYRGPMAQRWAAVPGAVVRLRLDGGLTADQARDLEAHPLGERVVDGHGQFTLLPVPPGGPAPLAPTAVPLAAAPSAGPPPARVPPRPAPAGAVPEDPAFPTAPEVPAFPAASKAPAVPTVPGGEGGLDELYDELLWNAASRPVRDHARSLARDSARGLAPLTPSLLGRLREVVGHPHRTPEDALSALGRTVSGRARGRADRAGTHKALHDRAVRALAGARLTRPGRPGPVPVQSWLGALADGGAAAAWWRDNRPEPPHSPAYSRAIAAVDLSLTDGLPPRDHPSGLSPRARVWERRAAPRLALLLASSWLSEAGRVLRAVQEGRHEPGGGG
ncbi:hypothetical protein ACIRPH_27640 [Nocardiopsis sp. NPDC101807]|uniref:hypothetical protein n=1 Tax=Nocardiopsis sp. NPDC101807 TaxID=3364339 RepID=UPI0037F3404C